MDIGHTQQRILGRFPCPDWLTPAVIAFNRFTRTPSFIYLVAALAIFANVCQQELSIYTLYTVTYIFICLFCQDMLPVMPMVFTCYIIPSSSNNPAINSASIFSFQSGGAHILLLAAIVVALLVVRLFTDKTVGFAGIKNLRLHLLIGILLLGIAYMVSGIGVKEYPALAAKNIFFSFLQFASLIVPYFVFAVMVDWKHTPKNYFCHIGLASGLILFAELAYIYLSQNVIVDGIIKREFIYTGWGIYNNIGGMMAMMLPFPFYFACKQRSSIPGILLGTLIMGGILLTSSRSSILVGAAIYGICVIMTLLICKDKIGAFATIGCFLIGGIIIAISHLDKLASLFEVMIQYGFHSNGRIEMYANGIRQFTKYPLFGGTFYPLDYTPYDYSELASFSSFFPPRWHNTIIQLLACCGIAGLAAYIFHCSQTMRVYSRKPSLVKTCIGLSALALMAASLFDCHFFNIGPVLFYSMALAFAENADPVKAPSKV